MKVDIPVGLLDELKSILEDLSTAAETFKLFDGSDPLIEPWRPSDSHEWIDIPQLNVELLRRAARLKIQLKL